MENLKTLQLRISNKVKENNGKKLKVLYSAIIAILLFIISISIKGCVSFWYWKNHGLGFYWTNPTGFFGKVYTGDVWYLEAYVDSSYYYEPYLQAFRYENWNPYAGGLGPLNGYAYGPMFIFGMYFISLIISLLYPNMLIADLVPFSVKWTHIVFDSLSVLMVYFIVISLKNFKKYEIKRYYFGALAALIFACMPINLIYVDSLYLNTPQMTFFALLSLFLFMKDKYRIGAFILSVAWLSKQMPLFFVIPWFFIVWKKKDLKSAFMDFLLPFLFTTIIISLPWLILSPYGYVRRVFGPGRPLGGFDVATALSSANNGKTVTLAHSFLELGAEKLAIFYHTINSYMVPFVIFYLLAVMLAYFNGKEIGNNESYLIIITTWIAIGTHLFISRGVYKYYNAFLTPFVLLGVLVFFDDLAHKVVSMIPKLYRYEQQVRGYFKTKVLKKTEIKELKELKLEIRTKQVIFYTFLVSMFLGSSALFYYFNHVLIANSRFLHPLYLLILLIVVSLFIHPSMYASLFKAESYKMIWVDLVYIYKECVRGINSFAKYCVSLYLKIQTIVKTFIRNLQKKS